MRVVIITMAGISSRFNKKIPEEQRVLKAIYSIDGARSTLLYHLLKKCSYADKIILVGGYRFERLYDFYMKNLCDEFPQVILVKNDHYEDLASGYSLYMGIKEATQHKADEVLFVEGDLDIDNESFQAVVGSSQSVITYTNEPIYANKAVVLYKDIEGKYKYVFNNLHGLLTIDEPFSCILNSGQMWKFANVEALYKANIEFYEYERTGTNLGIIQRYINLIPIEEIALFYLKRWTNCNTLEDYLKILNYWRAET